MPEKILMNIGSLSNNKHIVPIQIHRQLEVVHNNSGKPKLSKMFNKSTGTKRTCGSCS